MVSGILLIVQSLVPPTLTCPEGFSPKGYVSTTVLVCTLVLGDRDSDGRRRGRHTEGVENRRRSDSTPVRDE